LGTEAGMNFYEEHFRLHSYFINYCISEPPHDRKISTREKRAFTKYGFTDYESLVLNRNS